MDYFSINEKQWNKRPHIQTMKDSSLYRVKQFNALMQDCCDKPNVRPRETLIGFFSSLINFTNGEL